MVAAGFIRWRLNWTGRPGYNSNDLITLYVYGDLNRVHSSRGAEAETHCNLKVTWRLQRRLKPDCKDQR